MDDGFALGSLAVSFVLGSLVVFLVLLAVFLVVDSSSELEELEELVSDARLIDADVEMGGKGGKLRREMRR